MKTFPRTTVVWPNQNDSPLHDAAELEDAHVVFNGNTATIRRRAGDGRLELVDRILEATWKGQAESGSISGVSEFMTSMIGIDPDEAHVVVDVKGGKNQCLNC